MSLKIIHTADWHLGQSFFGYDRDVEHQVFLDWLLTVLTEKQIDVLLIAGDVFDVANPSAGAQRMFYHFLKEANRLQPHLQIVVIAGNHDSAVRLEAPNPLLEELNTRIIGLVNRKESGEIDFDSLIVPLKNQEGEEEALCLAVPFLRQGDYPRSEENHDSYVAGVSRMYQQIYAYVKEKRSANEAVIALGHLHATGAKLSEDDRSERVIMGGLESVAVDAFAEGLAYTALGHIHKAQRVGGKENVRYSGSPLPMSFSEKNYCHQVVEVQIEDGKTTQIEPIEIPRLVDLLRVPEKPQVPEEVLKCLAEFPESVDQSPETWPFIEVRVLLTEPDPGFRHRVEEVLKEKAVRLTSIVPSYPERAGEDFKPLSYGDLQKIDPLDMLRHAFTVKYGGELPKEMEDMFTNVIREISL